MILERCVFQAMGNTAVIELDARHAHLLDLARRRVFELERLWSRFSKESDVTRLNLSAGTPVLVAPETLLLIEHLREAHSVTTGLFDPTLLPTMNQVGYGESLTNTADVSIHHPQATSATPLSTLTVSDRFVSTPAVLALDPGGLGKGLAADVVLGELEHHGAEQVCIALGGDLAFSGTPRRIDVLSPTTAAPIASLALNRGGVATSSVTAKTFETALGRAHHVIDPRTLAPVDHDVVQVTVAASTCAWAEAFATATLVSGDTRLVDEHGLAALLVHQDGSIEASESWEKT